MKALPAQEYTLDEVLAASKTRWLNIYELEYLLNPETTPLETTPEPPKTPPPSGTLLLFDRGTTRTYKSDGYDWVKKRNSQKVREDHVKLRIEGKCRVAGVYVHCTDMPTLHRRAYYLLDPETGASKSPLQYPKKNGDTAADPTQVSRKASSLILLHYLDTRNMIARAAEKKAIGAVKNPTGRGRKKSNESDPGRRRSVKAGTPRTKAKATLVVRSDKKVKGLAKKRQMAQIPIPQEHNTDSHEASPVIISNPTVTSEPPSSLHKLLRSCDNEVMHGLMGESFGSLSALSTEYINDMVKIDNADEALDTIWNMIIEDDMALSANSHGTFQISANVCVKPHDEYNEKLFDVSENHVYDTMGMGICASADNILLHNIDSSTNPNHSKIDERTDDSNSSSGSETNALETLLENNICIR
mmetsp:Transcript_30067/g.36707  ORF Transcript_30067/g.36707 Transcript_30067/m.36707 type:complete len:415 (-) Transcript_30067:267-1511(-)|eukprot:CAMPEP_0172512976 /NCGR_PEP_ID=MMETSP1066-20121228/248501_1 /TAXON_ID=671091 /ORGANISM="Coscinodiscus wailesii, Strain CCMP2513" /LENGTH=414 /DNA_ID=CAMNT_0013293017 /DNA_START=117 /DNA_END=1361 /DNA_ORIENTATION=+